MQYRLAFDPNLELSAAEFVAAWNAGQHAAGAPAALGKVSGESFMSPELSVAIAIITTAASIPAAIVTNVVSAYLKKKYIDKASPKVTVTTISAADGEPLWIIKQEEE